MEQNKQKVKGKQLKIMQNMQKKRGKEILLCFALFYTFYDLKVRKKLF